ncbi:MAG: hypothetical protein QFB86_00570 [Patescibacteria group bacterium]|nr:hypothetical protein [Patescibacteria group bacterium]
MAATRLQSGVEHITDRRLDEMDDFIVPELAKIHVASIFNTENKIKKNLSYKLGRQTVSCYVTPELIVAPANVDLHEYALLLGKASVKGKYVIGFTMVNEEAATYSDDATALAEKYIQRDFYNDSGSNVVLFEQPSEIDSESLPRLARLRELIAGLDVPSAVIIAQ